MRYKLVWTRGEQAARSRPGVPDGPEEDNMLWHIGELAGMALVAGVVAGLVVATAGAVAAWLLYRRVRRRVETFTGSAARYALQTVAHAGASGRERSPAPVLPGLRRRAGPPGAW
jgi:hypothetical protein